MFDVPAHYNFVCNGVRACHFVSTSQCLAHGVKSGLGHTLKALPEATIGCKVLLREHSGRLAPRGIRHSRATGHRKSTIPVR